MKIISPEIISYYFQCKRKAFLAKSSQGGYKKTDFELMNQVGVTLTVLRPSGTIMIGDKRVERFVCEIAGVIKGIATLLQGREPAEVDQGGGVE